MADAIRAPSRDRTIVLWVLRTLMAATFLFTGFAKLSGLQVTVDAFATLPVGQWFRYVTGALEVVGALALLAPPVSGLGALLLLIVDTGAFFADIFLLPRGLDPQRRHRRPARRSRPSPARLDP